MSPEPSALAGRLGEGTALVLDGAMGTELEHRGVPMSLPLWSAAALAHAPATVLDVHRAYVRAGADLIVTNTFRTLRRTLAAAGEPHAARQAATLAGKAVALAQQAAAETTDRLVFVLGSAGPLEDCFRPDLVPRGETLRREHAVRIDQLVQGGVDGLLLETMGSQRELEVAMEVARDAGLPVLAAVVLAADGNLLDGSALEAVLPSLDADAVLINCTPPLTVGRRLQVLADSGARAWGAYANEGLGHGGAESSAVPLDAVGYARVARSWLDAGATIVGGCCGTTPAHVRALRGLVDETVKP